MFPRNRLGAAASSRRSFGWNVSNTLRCVASVVRSLRSSEYTPDQRKVLPFCTSTPETSMPRPSSRRIGASPKSSPTTATMRTFVKYEAATAQ